jgi:hypothetical protein
MEGELVLEIRSLSGRLSIQAQHRPSAEKICNKSQVWWLTPVIPGTCYASLGKNVSRILSQPCLISALWFMSEIPASGQLKCEADPGKKHKTLSEKKLNKKGWRHSLSGRALT